MTEDSGTMTEAAPESGSEEHAIETVDVGTGTPKKWHERSTGGQTYFDRYFMPLLTPLVAVLGILFFVLNFSRVLLAGKTTIAIIAASVLTVAILAGAAALANAPKMRPQSLAVFTAVALMIISGAGLISVGHAKEKKETVKPCEPIAPKQATVLPIVVTGAIALDPAFAATAGCVDIQYSGPDGAHTLEFIDGPGGVTPTGPVLKSGSKGSAGNSWAFELLPGVYKVHCTIAGHEAMKATITVK